jgi:hypothetical protein
MRRLIVVIGAVGSLVATTSAQAHSDSGKHGHPEALPTVTYDGSGAGQHLPPPPPPGKASAPRRLSGQPGWPGKGDPFFRIK